MGIAALILAPIAYQKARNELCSLSRRQWLLLALSGLLLCLHFASWISSIAMTSITSSVVLVTTTPLWVAIMAPALLKERLSASTIFGLVVTLLGGVLVGLSNSCGWAGGTITCDRIIDASNVREMAGNGLALAGAWFSAGYLLVGRSLRKDLSLIGYTFVVYSFAALGLMILLLIFKQPIIGYPRQVYLIGLALAVVPQIIGHSSFNWALRYLPASFVSVALLGEPVGASILAVLLLHEAPRGLEMLGGVIILCGIYVSARSARWA
jgi:drug/metabolite transporter (DMT)-like permease